MKEQVTSVAVDVWSFTLVGVASVRLISLLVYTIAFGFYLDALPDRLTVMEAILHVAVIAYCCALGDPTRTHNTLRAKLPGELFSFTPIIFGICALGIGSLRVHQITSTCKSCPTYTSSGPADCETNPYAPTSTVDWTKLETYDWETLLQDTLTNNPQTTLVDDPILDFLEQCWFMGCSDCHPRHGWQTWLHLGSFFDFLAYTSFGFAIVLIKQCYGY